MTEAATTLTIRRPDDWHVHLRDGAMLRQVVGATAGVFGRAIVMPNLTPPVVTTALAAAYRARVVAAARAAGCHDFAPLMTLYLTDETDPADLAAGFRAGVLTAAKLYPAHATTNSAAGVRNLRGLAGVFEVMARIGMPLLIHGEVTDPAVDIFDREAVFIDRVLAPLIAEHPGLKVVFEHITTAEAARFVQDGSARLAATITPHHLQLNRNAMFAGGMRPHAYCLPVAKREAHRLALRHAATSGSAKFFLGTDSAPHAKNAKEAACGCAGIFNAPCALEAYAEVFDEEGALAHLEAFASINGARFYGLPVNEGSITLARGGVRQPAENAGEGGVIVPYRAGEVPGWRIAGMVPGGGIEPPTP